MDGSPTPSPPAGTTLHHLPGCLPAAQDDCTSADRGDKSNSLPGESQDHLPPAPTPSLYVGSAPEECTCEPGAESWCVYSRLNHSAPELSHSKA